MNVARRRRLAETVPSNGLIVVDNGSEQVSLGTAVAGRIRVLPKA